MHDLPFYQFHLYDTYYLIDFGTSIRKFSSAPYNGGIGTCRYYVNRTVPHDFCEDVLSEGTHFLETHAVEPAQTCMNLTACDVRKFAFREINSAQFHISVWVTAGISNALSIGSHGFSSPGTVNIAMLTDAPLMDSAAINGIQDMIEAKAQAFNDLKVLDPVTGKRTPGTSTDTVSLFIANTAEDLNFGGRLTDFGKNASVLVYDLVSEAIRKCSP
ncbi:MAG: adenosylcobinamide amidohydrolase [Thermoplasmataceae archaeon]